MQKAHTHMNEQMQISDRCTL